MLFVTSCAPVQGSLIHQMDRYKCNTLHAYILMEPSYILMKEEVYDIIWIGRKLSANPYIATPPNTFLLFLQILGFVVKRKEGVSL